MTVLHLIEQLERIKDKELNIEIYNIDEGISKPIHSIDFSLPDKIDINI